MFLHPGAVGAVVGARSAHERRYATRAADRALHNALVAELYARVPVLLMKVHISFASLNESLRSKALRLRVSIERRELMLSEKRKARSDEPQCARFDFNMGTEFMLQGDEVLCFEILQPHPIFPSKTLGKCLMSLSEVREALGGGRLTRTAGQPLLQELLLTVPKKLPEEVIGGLQVVVQMETSNLAAAMANDVLRDDFPTGLPGLRGHPYARGSALLAADRRMLQGSRLPYAVGVPARDVQMGTVVGQPVPQEPQLVRTADGGQMSTRSWLDSVTGQMRHEAILMDVQGNVIERVEWTDDQNPA